MLLLFRCSQTSQTRRHRKTVIRTILGIRNLIPAPKKALTCWMPALAMHTSTVLRLAALAALLGGGLVSAEFTPVDCCAQTATLLQDIAVLQRSLSQVAEALDASEARADALAGKLLKSERTVRGLQRENAALHSPLEAPPFLEEIPETIAALSQTRGSSSNTPQISPDAGDIRYPATLPVSGAQLAGDWHGCFQIWNVRTAGACMSGARVPGICSCGDASVSTASDPGRRYQEPNEYVTNVASLACIRAFGQ